MGEPLPDLAARLAKYAGELKDVSRAEAGLLWARLLERLAGLRAPAAAGAEGAGYAQEVAGALKLLADAEELLLNAKWVDMLSTRMSVSFVKQVEFERKKLVKALRAAGKGLRDGANAWVDRLGERGEAWGDSARLALEKEYCPFLSALVLRLLRSGNVSGEWAATTAVALKRIVAAERGRGRGDVAPGDHPLLCMTLSYGLTPAAGARREGDTVLRAALPGGQAVLYDLDTLLEGVDGGAASGLNFKLVSSLDTIRPLGGWEGKDGKDGKPAPSPRPPAGSVAARVKVRPVVAGGGCGRDGLPAAGATVLAREDAAGEAPRPLANPRGYDLRAMLGGPTAMLAGYGRLAEVAAFDPPAGFWLGNHLELLEAFEGGGPHGGGAGSPFQEYETRRHAKELTLAGRKARQALKGDDRTLDGLEPDEAAAAASAAASIIAHERFHEFSMFMGRREAVRPLPGALPSRGVETALTAFLQSARLRKGLERGLRGRRQPAGREVEHALAGGAGESASLKLACQLDGRPF